MAEGKAMSEFLPFSRPAMGVEELAAVKEVLESGWNHNRSEESRA